MAHQARRELLQGFLDDLVAQRDVDMRDVLQEVIHFVTELDDELIALRGSRDRPDGGEGAEVGEQ